MEWPAGSERCRSCGYVAIGAGLGKLPKKKKRRAGKYREPGSSTPFLSCALVVALGYYGFAYRPWENNFERIRTLFGGEPSLHVEGDYEVLKMVQVGQEKTAVAPENMTKGVFSFKKDGKAEFDLVNGSTPWKATAHYVQDDHTVTLSDFKTDPECAMPASMRIQFANVGQDTMLGYIDRTTVVHLRKLSGSDKLTKVLAYKMVGGELKGKDSEGDDE